MPAFEQEGGQAFVLAHGSAETLSFENPSRPRCPRMPNRALLNYPRRDFLLLPSNPWWTLIIRAWLEQMSMWKLINWIGRACRWFLVEVIVGVGDYFLGGTPSKLLGARQVRRHTRQIEALEENQVQFARSGVSHQELHSVSEPARRLMKQIIDCEEPEKRIQMLSEMEDSLSLIRELNEKPYIDIAMSADGRVMWVNVGDPAFYIIDDMYGHGTKRHLAKRLAGLLAKQSLAELSSEIRFENEDLKPNDLNASLGILSLVIPNIIRDWNGVWFYTYQSGHREQFIETLNAVSRESDKDFDTRVARHLREIREKEMQTRASQEFAREVRRSISRMDRLKW